MAAPLNEQNLALVAERFRLFGDVSRLRLLQVLREGEHTVADLTERCGMSQANVSKHLGILRRGGLVAGRKEGLFVYYRVADPTVFRLCDLMCGSIKESLAKDLAAFAPTGRRAARRSR
jgi:ArsR family transcriptional regulator